MTHSFWKIAMDTAVISLDLLNVMDQVEYERILSKTFINSKLPLGMCNAVLATWRGQISVVVILLPVAVL